MKIAVTGVRGRLGSELVRRGCIPVGVDITQPGEVQEVLGHLQPDVLIHCAAYTNVDQAEVEMEKALAVNVRGTHNVRSAFAGRMILLSTDFIFNGKGGPYREKAVPDPLSFYGMTKLGAEAALTMWGVPGDTIVRTTLLYGSPAKPDFVSRTLAKLKGGDPISVGSEAWGNPTFVPHLAEALMSFVYLPEKPPILHLSGLDWINRQEWALRLAKHYGFSLVNDTVLEEPVKGQALRPKRGGFRLDLAKRLGLPLYTLEQGLEEYIP